jgi:hypothetical protein
MSTGKKPPAIKTPRGPAMSDFKSAAAASREGKIKAMGFAGGGPVAQATFPIRPPVVAPLRSIAPSVGAKRPSIPGLAAGGNVGGRVTRGAAAEREMARMEREANRDHPKKG